MIQPPHIRTHLEDLAQNTQHVRGRLERGAEVSRNLHCGAFWYTIDVVNLYRHFGRTADDAFFRALGFLKQLDGFTFKMIFPPAACGQDGRIIAPFSRPIMRGYGEGLEKSVLVQLAEQERGDCFLVYGLLSHRKDPRPTPHVWNVLWRDGAPYLADAQNPVITKKSEQKREFPFVVPIDGMNERQFVIAESRAAGRDYSLPLR